MNARTAILSLILAAAVATVPPPRAHAAPDPVRLPPTITRASALENFDFVWQRIHDTHFDPTFNGVDWYRVRNDLRPRAARCRHIDSLRVVLWTMLNRLGQSHFGIIPSDRYDTGDDDDVLRRLFTAIPDHLARPGPGIDLRFIDGEAVVSDLWPGGSAGEAGVKRGWTITGIDGEHCDDLFDRCEVQMRRYRGSDWSIDKARFMVWALIHTALAGDEGTVVEVAFRDGDGNNVVLDLERRRCPWPVVAVAGMPALPVRVDWRVIRPPGTSRRIGFIAVHYFWLPGVVESIADAVDAMGDVDAVIVDIRGNLGGMSLVMQGAASCFVEHETEMGFTVGRDSRMPLVTYPRPMGAAGARVRPLLGPMALLTDRLTASASELFAAGLCDAGRARRFGEPTAGAALPAVISDMPNGDRLLHATFDFIRTNGESLEGRPLQPDVPAPLTRAALLSGRDPALDAALGWVLGELESANAP